MKPNNIFVESATGRTGATRPSRVAVGMAVLLAASFSGCALLEPQPPEQVVRQLATQRWQALLAKDLSKAYSYANPSYRKLNSVANYSIKRQQTPVQWIAVEINRVSCEKDKCVARIQLESKPMVPFAFKFGGTITAGLDETWILEDGQWWFLETL